MPANVYDVVIVGAGAAGMFSGICLDKNIKKIILEKNERPGIKVLLSGGERANVSNMDIEPTRDYFTQNKKFLHSIFTRYNQWDIMSFFAENGVNIVEEDRSRLILESGDSKELLACLLEKLKQNDCDLKCQQDIQTITKYDELYEITTLSGETYRSKQVILASGGKSFAHVGTTGQGYTMAQELGLAMVQPYRTLCGMATKRDLSEISGVSSRVGMKMFDRKNNPQIKTQNQHNSQIKTSPPTPLNPTSPPAPLLGEERGVRNKKSLYEETGPILFTHFGVSGPIIHNLSNALGEYLNSILGETSDEIFEKYIIENISITLDFDLEVTPKRAIKFFELGTKPGSHEEILCVTLDLQNWRSWREAKATGGGISTGEMDNHMQSKKYPGLYIVGEVMDVTGKTGGFNLQWAWSSGYSAAEHINTRK